MARHTVLGIKVGDIVENKWTVWDISYSADNKRIYLHLMYQKSRRSKSEHRTVPYLPLDIIEATCIRSSL